jgi:AcrR family transcriptional regulator
MGAPQVDVAAPRRADAARNRDALVQAGRVVFGERGLDAPLDEIARRAELGNATLYRHFPSRCELVVAVYTETLRDVVAATERALANPDPWDAFTAHVTFLCELQATNRGLADLLTTTLSGAVELEELQALAQDGFIQIVDRATAAGALCADFQPLDVVLLLMANAGLVHRTAAVAPTAWRRLLSFTLNGFATPAVAPGATAPAPDPAAIRLAMTDPATEGGDTPS